MRLSASTLNPDTENTPSIYKIIAVADRVFIVFGVLMLLGVVRFVLAGNAPAENPFNPGEGNPFVRASWYPLYLMIMAAILLRIQVFLRSFWRLLPVYLLVALSLASIAWSIAPDISLRRIVAVVMTVGFGLYLGLRGDWRETLKYIGVGCAIAAFANVVLAIGLPSVGVDTEVHDGAWKGLTVEKNALGGDMARAALIFMALAHIDVKHRVAWLGALLLSVLCVLGSTSTTALLGIMIPSLFFAVYLVGTKSVFASLSMVYASIVGAGVLACAIVFFPEFIAELLGKDVTLTGRTDIWSLVGQKISDHPLTGYGLGAFWVNPYGPCYTILYVLDWIVPSAHNSWLEMGLDLGFPGIFLLLIITGIALVRSIFMLFARGNPWPLSALGQLILFSFSESTILWSQNVFSCSMFMFFVVIASMPAKERLMHQGPLRMPGSIRGRWFA